jgi:hypothetical protein
MFISPLGPFSISLKNSSHYLQKYPFNCYLSFLVLYETLTGTASYWLLFIVYSNFELLVLDGSLMIFVVSLIMLFSIGSFYNFP